MKKDFSGLQKFRSTIEAIAAQKDAFMASTAAGIAAIFLREVKKRTPVGVGTFETVGVYKRGKRKGQPKLRRVAQGGTLRRGWYAGNVEKRGRIFLVSVRNPVKYAPYVEYGHRQTPGRYVPVIGKRLKQRWVEGQFMMTHSRQTTKQARQNYAAKRYKEFLKRFDKDGK